jgi:hypothetical protein
MVRVLVLVAAIACGYELLSRMSTALGIATMAFIAAMVIFKS